jgi:hypothetical protein
MEHEGLSLHSVQAATCLSPDPNEFSPHHYLTLTFIFITPPSNLGLAIELFPSHILTKILYAFPSCVTLRENVSQSSRPAGIPSFLATFTKLRKVTISFITSVYLSVCPHGTTQLTLDGFS